MRIRAKKLSLGFVLATVALAGAAAATEIVILDPVEVIFSASFGGDTLTKVKVFATSTDGLEASETFTAPPYSLTVENGRDYRPSLLAFFENPTASESYLQVSRSTPVHVDKQGGPTTLSFNYGNVGHINYSIVATGSTIAAYDVRASASAAQESYSARNLKSFGAPRPSSASSRLFMVPDDQVFVYGTVTLQGADGTQVQRSLEQKTVNLLGGDQNVGWELDTSKGQLVVDVDAVPGAVSRRVYFYGVSGSASISGSKSVGVDLASFSLELPPGPYDVYVRTYVASGYQYFETKPSRVEVKPNEASPVDLGEALGYGQMPLSVSGFFSREDIDSAQIYLRRVNPGAVSTYAYSNAVAGGGFDFTLGADDWKRDGLYLGLSDLSDPDLPLNNSFRRYYYNVASAPAVDVPAGATVDLGTEAVTLVKANAYLRVQSGGPQMFVKNPYVYLRKSNYNPDNSLKGTTEVYAYGSSEAREVSGFTMVAEPGTYDMQAFATVNGSLTEFPGKTITFAQPVDTPPGGVVEVAPLTPSPELGLTLTFSDVSSGGITTVVETPLAPDDPPAGLKMYCAVPPQQGEGTCNEQYYDIQSTAAAGSVEVCIRKRHVGGNAVGGLLGLYKYAADTSADTRPWERIDTRLVDCFESDESMAACGCTTLESCGINLDVDPPVFAFMICGELAGSAGGRMSVASTAAEDGGNLLAIFEKEIGAEFTNVVNGVEYTGPSGPPSPQTWTVPASGTYRIEAVGAQGAAATQAGPGVRGGCGAEIAGDFALNAGDTLEMLVGQKGTAAASSGGGGGGSFVVRNGVPLLVAGGGGGVRAGATVSGRAGGLTSAGVSGSTSANYTSGFIVGGVDGKGGARVASYGSGGGGWDGNGASDGTYGEGGFSFLLGGKGGAGKGCGAAAPGGYGGGGAGNGCFGGGGGGGYSGGGGGRVAGGGGSWNTGANASSKETCSASGHGKISIKRVPAQAPLNHRSQGVMR
jgi:hypothetical protein